MVCAVAILSIITTTIGGALVVSTNSYRRGTVETALQQEAQFTANMIESLIIDATSSVDYSGGVLSIDNPDYTYAITYDSGARTLSYTQTDKSSGAVDSGLLAEHVKSFNADTSDFATYRNVRLQLNMENSGRTFNTAYNITSRNNPTAGTTPSPTAVIQCLNEIVLEPGQGQGSDDGYLLPVTVVCSAGTGYSCYFENEPDGTLDATAVPETGGIRIRIGTTEDGGSDGLLRLWIRTDATDSSTGAPLQSKCVTVKIRRVTDVDLPAGVCIAGSDLQEGAVYAVSAHATGTNLDKVMGVSYDENYVDPDTIKWSFSVTGDGSATGADYVEVLAGENDNDLRFKLKKDIEAGVSVTITATAQHPRGTNDAGVRTNKSGNYYDTVEETWVLRKLSNFSLSSQFLRGDDNLEIVESVPWQEIKDTYGGGNGHPVRYVRFCTAKLNQKDELIALTGTWTDWKQLTDGGTSGRVIFRPGDYDIDYSEAFWVQVQVQWVKDNGTVVWPTSSTAAGEYSFEFGIPAVTLVFDYYEENGQKVPLGGGITGLDYDNRLKLTKNYRRFHVTTSAGHMSKCINNNMSVKVQKKNGSDWVDTSGVEWGFEYESSNTGYMKFSTQNNVPAGSYRAILTWRSSANASQAYADEETGKGIFYFDVQ
jgi:hypothetical protein